MVLAAGRARIFIFFILHVKTVFSTKNPKFIGLGPHREKKLDEIHLWNYSRNDSDTTWVNSLKSDKIKIFTSDDRTKIDYENGGSSWKVDNFSLVWKEYTKEIYEDSLFVKMDDDIVYVDITKFDEIFDFVKNNDPY